jgi:hypothetical protein
MMGEPLFMGDRFPSFSESAEVNERTGKLTRLHTYDVGKSLTWVMAVKFDAE